MRKERSPLEKNTVFRNLREEKRIRIISAGFTAFGRNGYRKTSMADVSEAAGISKAALFYYFGSKQKFFCFLYDFCIDAVCTGICSTLQDATDDFFERISVSQDIKLRLMRKYEGMFSFLTRAYTEDDPQVSPYISGSNEAYLRRGTGILLKGIDRSKFKAGTDIMKILKIAQWISEGFGREAVAEGLPAEEMIAGFEPYMNMMKKTFYREGSI